MNGRVWGPLGLSSLASAFVARAETHVSESPSVVRSLLGSKLAGGTLVRSASVMVSAIDRAKRALVSLSNFRWYIRDCGLVGTDPAG